jgi:hypothetical protein
VVLPYLIGVASLLVHWSDQGPSRGDLGLIELATRSASSGAQLVGPYSRFGFAHPGPTLFYLWAPIWFTAGGTSAALALAALCSGFACAVLLLFLLWRRAGPVPYLVFTVLLVQFEAQMGGNLFSAWNPYATVLPFLLSVVAFGAVAAGGTVWLPLAAASVTVAVQSHLGYTPAALSVAAAALVLSVVRVHRQGTSRAALRRASVIAAAVLLALWALPIYEQHSRQPGNLSRIVSFFFHSSGAHSWKESISVVCQMVANVPRSMLGVLLAGVSDRTFLDLGMACGIVLIALLPLALNWARRAANAFLVAMACLSLPLLFATALSVRSIVGPIEPYLLAWMPALGVIVGGTLVASALVGVQGQPARTRKTAALGALVIVLLVAPPVVRATGSGWQAFVPNPSEREGAEMVAATRSFFAGRGIRACAVRAVTGDDETWFAALVDALDRDGVRAQVDAERAFQYPPRFQLTALPHGVLLACRPQMLPQLTAWLGFTTVAAGESQALAWSSMGQPVEGELPFELLPAFALDASGFGEVQRAAGDVYRWCHGLDAALTLDLRPAQRYRLAVTVMPFVPSGSPQRLRVTVNGTDLGDRELVPAPVWQRVAFEVPAGIASHATRIAFHATRAAMRADALPSGYLFPLSVAYREIVLVPPEAAASSGS